MMSCARYRARQRGWRQRCTKHCCSPRSHCCPEARGGRGSIGFCFFRREEGFIHPSLFLPLFPLLSTPPLSRRPSPGPIASMTIFSSLSLYYCLCCFEVTVTSVPLSPFVSLRGLVNTNQRLSALKYAVTVTSVSLPPFVSRRGLPNTNQRLSLVINIIISRVYTYQKPTFSLSEHHQNAIIRS